MKARSFIASASLVGIALLALLGPGGTRPSGPVSAASPSVNPADPPFFAAEPSAHVPYDPFTHPTTFPEYPSKPQSSQLQPRAVLAKPTGIDLDVTYISRAPMYNRYKVWYTADGRPYLRPGTENDKRWPGHGEIVTFTAHFINKGTTASSAFGIRWLMDGVQAHSGTHPSLSPGEEGTETYQWAWAHTVDGERLLGQHSVQFEVDPDDTIAETYESNNSLADRTDAVSLVLALTPELYNALETPVDPQWPFSAEVSFTWGATGTQAITVRATNPASAVTGTHVIHIVPGQRVYLPLVLRRHP